MTTTRDWLAELNRVAAEIGAERGIKPTKTGVWPFQRPSWPLKIWDAAYEIVGDPPEARGGEGVQ
jgi:hypothetical protein